MRAILDASLDAVVGMDANGIIDYWNPRAETMFGWTQTEAIGRNMAETIIPVRYREAHARGLQHFLNTGEGPVLNRRVEITALRRDGTEFPVELSISPLTVGETYRFNAFIADTTERKHAETALRESQERFRQLAENIREVFWLTNVDKSEMLYISPGYEHIWGRTCESLYNAPHTWLDAIHAEDKPRVLQTAFSKQVTGEYEEEYRIFQPDGSVRWIRDRAFAIRDQSGSVYRIAGVAEDITASKQAERRQAAQVEVSVALAEAKTLNEAGPRILQAIADSMGWGLGEIWRVDHQTNVLRCEASWQATSMQAEAFVLASRAITFSPGVGLPGSVWSAGEPAWIPDVLTDANFPRAAVATQAGLHAALGFPIQSGDEFYGVIEFFSRDIQRPDTDLLRMLTDVGIKIGQFLRRQNIEEQFHQAQKMEAVGRLAGGVAHDFNNLLTVIRGYSDLLLGRLPTADPIRRDMEEVKKAADRAASLTRQLLAFSRRQVLQPRILDLNAEVAKMGAMLQRMIGEDIDLLTVLSPGLGSVKADPGQIEQILMNLAVNARDAMPNGGRLTIETTDVVLDAEYARRHVAVNPGRYVVLAVSDTGCGMDAATQTRIFEPFFTTKERGKGTGLGLSTVYGIVKQSGGNIWVYSERGRGTVFKIYLPRVEGPAEAIDPGMAQETVSTGSETILLVEDNPMLRTLAKEILCTHGYTVLEAAQGEEACRISEHHTGTIHLMLSDVVMPGMKGRELAERLKSARPTIKVLLMSGYSDTFVLHQREIDPGTAFLQKPFSPQSLAQKVREVLSSPQSLA